MIFVFFLAILGILGVSSDPAHCSMVDVTLVSQLPHSTHSYFDFGDKTIVIRNGVSQPMWSATATAGHIVVSPAVTPVLVYSVHSVAPLVGTQINSLAALEPHVRWRHTDGRQETVQQNDPLNFEGNNGQKTSFDLDIQLSQCKRADSAMVHVGLVILGCSTPVQFAFSIQCPAPASACPGLMISSSASITPDVAHKGIALFPWGNVDSSHLHEVQADKDSIEFNIWCEACDPPVYFESPFISADYEVVWPSLRMPNWPLVANHKWYPLNEKPAKFILDFQCHAPGSSVVAINIQPAFYKPFQIVVHKICPANPMLYHRNHFHEGMPSVSYVQNEFYNTFYFLYTTFTRLLLFFLIIAVLLGGASLLFTFLYDSQAANKGAGEVMEIFMYRNKEMIKKFADGCINVYNAITSFIDRKTSRFPRHANDPFDDLTGTVDGYSMTPQHTYTTSSHQYGAI